jgi:hypothetical protein
MDGMLDTGVGPPRVLGRVTLDGSASIVNLVAREG